jgi:hypothetical protein
MVQLWDAAGYRESRDRVLRDNRSGAVAASVRHETAEFPT